MNTKVHIDYLTEDPVIPSQQYALYTVVGPGYRQECDIYGFKIRGCTRTQEEAKALARKLMKVDNVYDIRIVEVGKFFPIDVNPNDIPETIYGDDRLNDLMKAYKDSKDSAESEWARRKDEQVKLATEHGKNPTPAREHQNSIIQQLKTMEMNLSELKRRFETDYTPEERESAQSWFNQLMETIATST